MKSTWGKEQAILIVKNQNRSRTTWGLDGNHRVSAECDILLLHGKQFPGYMEHSDWLVFGQYHGNGPFLYFSLSREIQVERNTKRFKKAPTPQGK